MQLKVKLLTLSLFLSSMVIAQVKVPAPSPKSTLEQEVGLSTITVEYSRPSMKNRIIFGDLVPFDEMWRTGANASTKITFSEDVKVEGKNLEKGTYALYAVPGEIEWEFVFYTDTENWGVPREWDDSKEALRVAVESEEIPWTVETMTIDINNLRDASARVNLIWESTMVGFNVTLNTDEAVQATIDKTLAGPGRGDYYLAARYYYSSEKDLEQAHEWIKMANEIDSKFWQLRLQSLIEAKLGMKKEAIETAKKSMAMAEEAGNNNYVRMNRASIAEWTQSMQEGDEQGGSDEGGE